MKYTKRLMVASLAAVCGCSASQDAPQGNAALGVAAFQQTETANELKIVALDGNQAVVGTLTLQLGPFVMQDDGRNADGRRLNVEIDNHKWWHESDGYLNLQLPLFDNPDSTAINAFLLDPHVRPVLESRGVGLVAPTFQGVPQNGERAYSGNSCYYGFSGSCGMTSCAARPVWYDWDGMCNEFTDVFEQEAVCCGSSKVAVWRDCGLGVHDPCGTEGPNGCAVCSSQTFTTSCDAVTGGYQQLACQDSGGDYSWLDSNHISMTSN